MRTVECDGRETKADRFFRVFREPTAGTEEGDVRVVRKLESGATGIVTRTECCVGMINHIGECIADFAKQVIPGEGDK